MRVSFKGSTYPGRSSNTTFKCLKCSLLLWLLFWLLIIMIFRHHHFSCDIIKHCVFSIFFFLFLFLQLILIQDLFIEYYISAPNDFVNFIINTISNKGTFLLFCLKLCSIFIINVDKGFTTKSL